MVDRDVDPLYRKIVSQDAIMRALVTKIEGVCLRPRMYVGGHVDTAADPDALHTLLLAYLDALAIACSGYSGGFVFGHVPAVDPTRTDEENERTMVAAVREVIKTVPFGPIVDQLAELA